MYIRCCIVFITSTSTGYKILKYGTIVLRLKYGRRRCKTRLKKCNKIVGKNTNLVRKTVRKNMKNA